MSSPATPAARALIESDRVEGTAVYDREGRHTGTVKRLMIDRVSGQVAYVVVAFAFAGLSDDSYPIPWAKLRYDTGLGGYRTGITERQLQGGPKYSSDNDWNWEDQTRTRGVNDYYGVIPT